MILDNILEKRNKEVYNFLLRSGIAEIISIIMNYEKLEVLNKFFFSMMRKLLTYGESQINISNFVKEEFEDFGIFESLTKLSFSQNIDISFEAESIIDTFWNEDNVQDEIYNK